MNILEEHLIFYRNYMNYMDQIIQLKLDIMEKEKAIEECNLALREKEVR
jgi:hypothetical protein